MKRRRVPAFGMHIELPLVAAPCSRPNVQAADVQVRGVRCEGSPVGREVGADCLLPGRVVYSHWRPLAAAVKAGYAAVNPELLPRIRAVELEPLVLSGFHCPAN